MTNENSTYIPLFPVNLTGSETNFSRSSAEKNIIIYTWYNFEVQEIQIFIFGTTAKGK
jgi:hypothetical protein